MSHAPPPSYEFGPDDGRVMADLAAKMRFVGILTVGLGLLALLYGIGSIGRSGVEAGPIVAVLTAVLLVLGGYWSLRGGREFLLVARTEGADVGHLMKALGNLRRLYGLQASIGWVALVLLVAAIVFGVFADRAR